MKYFLHLQYDIIVNRYILHNKANIYLETQRADIRVTTLSSKSRQVEWQHLTFRCTPVAFQSLLRSINSINVASCSRDWVLYDACTEGSWSILKILAMYPLKWIHTFFFFDIFRRRKYELIQSSNCFVIKHWLYSYHEIHVQLTGLKYKF